MATIINADTSDGLKLTSDTSGQIDFQSAGSTKATIDTSGNLKFDSGFGSVGTAYGCRAWVNFNGTGTVAIRDSGNVSSITDNGTGDYTVSMSTAMTDSNYSYTVNTMAVGAASTVAINQNSSAADRAQTTTTFRFITRITGAGSIDALYNNVIVVR